LWAVAGALSCCRAQHTALHTVPHLYSPTASVCLQTSFNTKTHQLHKHFNFLRIVIAPQLRCLGLRALLRGPVPAAPSSWVPSSSAAAGRFWAVQTLVPGIALEICGLWLVCLGVELEVAWGIGARGPNGSKVSKGPYETLQAYLGGLRLGLSSVV
jgi:hypothetical protein